MNTSETRYNCPHCEEEIIYSRDNPHRPFCSERCKMIDLGKWSNEEYSVPADQEQDWQGDS